tara:strand:- start:39 stop:1481 length:1443 start_codon:yes stop_codon:yes gene_type:complete
MTFISCETAEEKFGKNETPCNNGDVDMNWLTIANINCSKREYQREKVALLYWKQNIIKTILSDLFAGIPEIHIRVIKIKGTDTYRYELIDGQQRVTSILGFLNGEFHLPHGMVVDGMDVSLMDVNMLRDNYPRIYDRIMDYRISCKWYENIDDQQTAFLFIKILNNTNQMKPQEIRNAVLGAYSTFVRDTARLDKPHEVFSRVKETVKGKTKEKLKYFNFALKGRMEVDEWLSELTYLWKNGATKGVNHNQHFDWVEEMQGVNGEYKEIFKDEKHVVKLLDLALSLLKSVNPTDKSRLSSMLSMMMVLYANDLKNRYGGKIIEKTFTTKFFATIDKYSDYKTKLYENFTWPDGKPMGPFKDIFGGKNSKAITKIFEVFNKELDNEGLAEFGVIEIDTRNFKRDDIVRKWKDQDGLCYYTKEPLKEEEIAGDHLIARSNGIANGGVTEYDNLVVTSMSLNLKKSNMSEESFKKLIAVKKAA